LMVLFAGFLVSMDRLVAARAAVPVIKNFKMNTINDDRITHIVPPPIIFFRTTKAET
jgi:hypothetical protein